MDNYITKINLLKEIREKKVISEELDKELRDYMERVTRDFKEARKREQEAKEQKSA